MAINEELTRIKNAKEAIKTSIEAKGVTVGNGTIDTYASKINEIPSGVDINEYYDLTKRTSGDITKYIKQIPLIDTSSYTSTSSMFSNFTNLTTIPQLDTSKVTNISSMFSNCTNLTTIPQLDTSKVIHINGMFYKCTNLISIPQLDTSNVINIEGMFNYCSNLTTLGGFKDLGKAYGTTTSANYYNYKLDLSTCTKLTHDSLMNVINNLYDIATAGVQPQQLDLGSTNLAKLTEEEISIATNKGWTVI